jgi:protein-S-isoprenylcysteine O-methyltransferase Ste14
MRQLLQRWGFTPAGLISNRHGEWWLLAQLLLIAALAAPPFAPMGVQGWPWPLRLLGASTLGLGLVLVLLAFRDLGASLTPLPDPMPGAALRTEGSYRRCRHPLYQALLLAGLGWTLLLGSLQHLLLLIALAVVLVGKARREEAQLLRQHPAYADYAAITPAILPGMPWLDWRCPGPR